MNEKDLKRFMGKVLPEPNSGCWLWDGYVRENGYGEFSFGRQLVRAHRAAYEHFAGEIPAGLDLDHLCRVRCCVNPAHLEPVTRQTNLLRGESYWRNKTHCPNGHPFDDGNTYTTPSRPKARYCRECMRVRSREYMRRKRATQ
jgi:hypothetical protein